MKKTLIAVIAATFVFAPAANAADFFSAVGAGRAFVNSSIPDAATWALLILGLYAVGYSMRRHPSTRLSQAA